MVIMKGERKGQGEGEMCNWSYCKEKGKVS